MTVKNLGIPLRLVNVGLTGFTKGGSVAIPLKQLEFDQVVQTPASLEKGMLSQFALRSFELNPGEKQMLSALDDDAVNVCLGVYSNGFLVKNFRIHPHCASVRGKWNTFAHKANAKFEKKKERWGKTYSYAPKILPTFVDAETELKMFIRAATAEASSPPIIPQQIFRRPGDQR